MEVFLKKNSFGVREAFKSSSWRYEVVVSWQYKKMGNEICSWIKASWEYQICSCQRGTSNDAKLESWGWGDKILETESPLLLQIYILQEKNTLIWSHC